MEDAVRKFLEKNRDEIDLGREFSLTSINSGESNNTFEVRGDRNLIVRTSKEDSPDRIPHEKDVLKFLEQQGVENVPKLVQYKEDSCIGQPVIVETSVGEEELDIEEATEKQIENLAELMAEFHSIPVDAYNRFFGTEKPDSVTLQEELERDFREYSKKPFKEYLSLVDNPHDRVEHFYQNQKKLLQNVDEEVEVQWSFVNGDIPNNLRHTDDNVYLVDWELSGIGVPYIELIEFFVSGKVSEELQDSLMSEYEKRYDLPSSWQENVDLIEKFHGFNSMIWAAKKKEQKDESKYRKMFEQRLGHLENLYEE